MPNRSSATAILVLLVLVAGLAVWLEPAPVIADDEGAEIAGVEWLTDLDVARAKARESGRPILAVFR